MPVTTWNAPGTRQFEAGVDKGMLYPLEGPGVAWNGLSNITQNPVNAEPVPVYIDGEVYRRDAKPTDYQATLQAFNYPDEFLPCDGLVLIDGVLYDGQIRQEFQMSYRTLIGNDLLGTDYAYKIHLIYQAIAAPSTLAYASQGGTTGPTMLSWTLHTRPITVSGLRPTAHAIVDSRYVTSASLTALEKILYGGSLSTEVARMPTLTELANTIVGNATGTVTNSYPGLTLYPSMTLYPRA